MAVTSGFYNSLNGDRRYDAIAFGSMFDGIINDGVFETYGGAMMVTADGGDMIIKIAIGRAWFDHSWILNDSILNMEIEQSEVVLDRIDAVVIETNNTEAVRENTIKIIKGEPASIPVKPNLIHNEDVNQYALAYITVPAESTEVIQARIENAVGTEGTPFVTGVLETLDVTALVAQWQAQFGDLMTEDQIEFLEWFDSMKDQLSEDAAGHLQAEIDAIVDYNTFNIATTDWLSNSDVNTSTDYPYVVTKTSTLFSDTSTPIWQMNGVGALPTETERESINMVLEAVFSSSGVTLYATDLPTDALVLEVKGR